MTTTRFAGTEMLFDGPAARMVRAGHPEHREGVWIVEMFGELGERRTIDTADEQQAERWLSDLRDGAWPDDEAEKGNER